MRHDDDGVGAGEVERRMREEEEKINLYVDGKRLEGWEICLFDLELPPSPTSSNPKIKKRAGEFAGGDYVVATARYIGVGQERWHGTGRGGVVQSHVAIPTGNVEMRGRVSLMTDSSSAIGSGLEHGSGGVSVSDPRPWFKHFEAGTFVRDLVNVS